MAKKNEKENNKKKHFFKDFKAELKKVIWPTPKQIVNNTVAVVVIVLITAFIVFILDLCFKAVNSAGVELLKAKTGNTQSVEVVEEQNNEENSESTENAEIEQPDAENNSAEVTEQ